MFYGRRGAVRTWPVLFGLSLGAVGCAGLFSVGDGYLGVAGNVYEWRSPPVGAQSTLLIDSTGEPPQGDLSPLEGCSVLVEPWASEKRPRSAETAEMWEQRGKSDQAGGFSVGGTAKPGRYVATISVACPGFTSTTHAFQHDRFRHQAMAVMVREESPQ